MPSSDIHQLVQDLELPNTHADALSFANDPYMASGDRLSSAAAIALIAPERMDELGITAMKDKAIELARCGGPVSDIGLSRIIWPDVDWNKLRLEGLAANSRGKLPPVSFDRIIESTPTLSKLAGLFRGDPIQFRAKMKTDPALRNRINDLMQKTQDEASSLSLRNMWAKLQDLSAWRFFQEVPTQKLISPTQADTILHGLQSIALSSTSELILLATFRRYYIATAEAVHVTNDGKVIIVEKNPQKNSVAVSLPDRTIL